ncbi:discoidin domain-containing protein [Sphaerisporangium fuscum]|uniref:discoidin domain-containing protein n=1 Tax=Sphaerisporangium fuscum TaxID=2835868 RepID=UPI001BDC2172|nr:discoidin domain-containing protein [Sphaerisporangium fuscum]
MKGTRAARRHPAVVALAVFTVTACTPPKAPAPSPAPRPPEAAFGTSAGGPSVRVRPGRPGGEGGLVPVSGAASLVAPLGVDPACPAAIELGARNESARAGFADLFLEVSPPLTASRSMISSYLPAGYELSAKVLVGVPPTTPPGTYDLTLRAGGRRLRVPVSVVAADRPGDGGNLALRRPVRASSQNVNANYPACSVVDGDRGSGGWAGGNGWNDATFRAWPDTLDIDLGGPRRLARVDLYTLDTPRHPAATVGLRDWDVQARVAGTWRTVARVRGNTAGRTRSDFAAVTADAVRVSALAANGAGDYSRVVEVEAYGP